MQSFAKASGGLDKATVNWEYGLVTRLGRRDSDRDFERDARGHNDCRGDDFDRCIVSSEGYRTKSRLDRAL